MNEKVNSLTFGAMIVIFNILSSSARIIISLIHCLIYSFSQGTSFTPMEIGVCAVAKSLAKIIALPSQGLPIR